MGVAWDIYVIKCKVITQLHFPFQMRRGSKDGEKEEEGMDGGGWKKNWDVHIPISSKNVIIM